jgi:amino acid transporter
MPSRTTIFKISVIAILGILGFFVGMVFLGILLMNLFGTNDTYLLVGGILGSIISILVGFIICKKIKKEDFPQYQHKQTKKGL